MKRNNGADSDLPEKLASPARRALAEVGIYCLQDLTTHTEAEINNLHGIGPNAVKHLREALTTSGERWQGKTTMTLRGPEIRAES